MNNDPDRSPSYGVWDTDSHGDSEYQHSCDDVLLFGWGTTSPTNESVRAQYWHLVESVGDLDF